MQGAAEEVAPREHSVLDPRVSLWNARDDGGTHHSAVIFGFMEDALVLPAGSGKVTGERHAQAFGGTDGHLFCDTTLLTHHFSQIIED